MFAAAATAFTAAALPGACRRPPAAWPAQAINSTCDAKLVALTTCTLRCGCMRCGCFRTGFPLALAKADCVHSLQGLTVGKEKPLKRLLIRRVAAPPLALSATTRRTPRPGPTRTAARRHARSREPHVYDRAHAQVVQETGGTVG